MKTKKKANQTPLPEQQGFIFFPHTADAKFQAYGTTLEEAFRNAAYALVALMWDREKIAPKIRHPVEFKAGDAERLLVDFLEEVLFLLDSRSFFLHAVEELEIRRRNGHYVLSGIFWGDANGERYETHGDVKAITYNEMLIERNGRFMVQVVVDV